jgi:hypothetical protein
MATNENILTEKLVIYKRKLCSQFLRKEPSTLKETSGEWV